MVTSLSIALSLASAYLTTNALAFTSSSPPSRESSRLKIRSPSTKILATSALFAADAAEPEPPASNPQADAAGREFSPGTIVSIAHDRSVMAYQVPKSAFGHFDPDSRGFVPRDETNATQQRGTRCLLLPGGLRGKVEKIYDTEWDRTHSILVRFEAGEDREGGGGFDVPKGFTMHFDANEIEVVDS